MPDRLEVHARTIEIAVNLITAQMSQMGMNSAEAIMVAGHLLAHLEKSTGIKFSEITSNFQAQDKKLDLVPPI
jgi:hypothetical protein